MLSLDWCCGQGIIPTPGAVGGRFGAGTAISGCPDPLGACGAAGGHREPDGGWAGSQLLCAWSILGDSHTGRLSLWGRTKSHVASVQQPFPAPLVSAP